MGRYTKVKGKEVLKSIFPGLQYDFEIRESEKHYKDTLMKYTSDDALYHGKATWQDLGNTQYIYMNEKGQKGPWAEFFDQRKEQYYLYHDIDREMEIYQEQFHQLEKEIFKNNYQVYSAETGEEIHPYRSGSELSSSELQKGFDKGLFFVKTIDGKDIATPKFPEQAKNLSYRKYYTERQMAEYAEKYDKAFMNKAEKKAIVLMHERQKHRLELLKYGIDPDIYSMKDKGFALQENTRIINDTADDVDDTVSKMDQTRKESYENLKNLAYALDSTGKAPIYPDLGNNSAYNNLQRASNMSMKSVMDNVFGDEEKFKKAESIDDAINESSGKQEKSEYRKQGDSANAQNRENDDGNNNEKNKAQDGAGFNKTMYDDHIINLRAYIESNKDKFGSGEVYIANQNGEKIEFDINRLQDEALMDSFVKSFDGGKINIMEAQIASYNEVDDCVTESDYLCVRFDDMYSSQTDKQKQHIEIRNLWAKKNDSKKEWYDINAVENENIARYMKDHPDMFNKTSTNKDFYFQKNNLRNQYYYYRNLIRAHENGESIGDAAYAYFHQNCNDEIGFGKQQQKETMAGSKSVFQYRHAKLNHYNLAFNKLEEADRIQFYSDSNPNINIDYNNLPVEKRMAVVDLATRGFISVSDSNGIVDLRDKYSDFMQNEGHSLFYEKKNAEIELEELKKAIDRHKDPTIIKQLGAIAEYEKKSVERLSEEFPYADVLYASEILGIRKDINPPNVAQQRFRDMGKKSTGYQNTRNKEEQLCYETVARTQDSNEHDKSMEAVS